MHIQKKYQLESFWTALIIIVCIEQRIIH